MSNTRSKATRGQLLRILGTLATLGLLAYLLSRQGWDEILNSIRQISLQRYLLVLGLSLVSRLAVTGRWSALLRLSGIDIPIRQIVRINFAGLFASNFLPTSVGGDLVRLAWMGRLSAKRAEYASSIAVDRLVGLAGMALLLPLGIAQAVSATSVLSFAMAWPLSMAVGGISASWPRRLWDKGMRGLQRTAELGRAWLSNPKSLLVALGFTFIHMSLMFTSMVLLFNGLGEGLAFWQVAGLWSFVYFVSLFPISINSLGLMEVSAGLVYSTLGGASVSSSLTVALLMRTASWMASLPGVVSLNWMLGLRRSGALAAAGEGDA